MSRIVELADEEFDKEIESLLRNDYSKAMREILENPKYRDQSDHIIHTLSQTPAEAIKRSSGANLWLREAARKDILSTCTLFDGIVGPILHAAKASNPDPNQLARPICKIILAGSALLLDVFLGPSRVSTQCKDLEDSNVLVLGMMSWLSDAWEILFSDSVHHGSLPKCSQSCLATVRYALRNISMIFDELPTRAVKSMQALFQTSYASRFALLDWLTVDMPDEVVSLFDLVIHFGGPEYETKRTISAELVENCVRQFGFEVIFDRFIATVKTVDPKGDLGQNVWRQRLMLATFIRSAPTNSAAIRTLGKRGVIVYAASEAWDAIYWLSVIGKHGMSYIEPCVIASAVTLLCQLISICTKVDVLSLIRGQELVSLVARLLMLMSKCDPVRSRRVFEEDVHQKDLASHSYRFRSLSYPGEPIEAKPANRLWPDMANPERQGELLEKAIIFAYGDLRDLVSSICLFAQNGIADPIRLKLQPIFLRTHEALQGVKFSDGNLAVAHWERLGNAVGLDAPKIRQSHRENSTRGLVGCFWSKCVVYRSPSHLKFLLCQGCKMAQYCDADNCQTRDWLEGGHKDTCGTRDHRLLTSSSPVHRRV